MPFKSQAQARKFRVMEAEGEIPNGTSSEWAHHTPGGIKKLPQHVKKHKKAADLSGFANDRMNDLTNHLGNMPTSHRLALILSGMGSSVLAGGALGGMAGAPVGAIAGGARGDMPEGIGRGVLRGGATGAGAMLGGMAGQAFGGPAGGLIGGGLGGAAGWMGSGKMLGKPHGKKEKEGRDMIIKVAHDYNIQPGDIATLGQALGVSAAGMASSALADPASFRQFLKLAADGTLRAHLSELHVLSNTPLWRASTLIKVARLLPRLQARQQLSVKRANARIRKLVVKKAALSLRGQMVSFLDHVASHIPVEKQASVRTLQTGIAKGMHINAALKSAYNGMSDFDRGKLATDLVRQCVQRCKEANALMGYGPDSASGSPGGGMASGGSPGVSSPGSMPTQGPMSMSGPASSSAGMMSKMAIGPAQPQPQQSSSGMGGIFGVGGAGAAGMLAMLLSKGRAGRAMGSMGRFAPFLAAGAGGLAGKSFGDRLDQSLPAQGVKAPSQAGAPGTKNITNFGQ